MKIQIVNKIDDETNEVYGFNMFDLTAVFVTYHVEVKPGRKRNWTITGLWDKYNNRHSNIEEPTLPAAIIEKVHWKIEDLVQVKTWDEYKGK